MKKQSKSALVTVFLLLAAAGILAQWRGGEVQLRIDGQANGEVVLSLRNGTSGPVRLYNSLRDPGEGETPGFVTIRLRDAAGEVLLTPESSPDGFWTHDMTQTSKVPTLAENMASNSVVAISTDFASLLQRFPDRDKLQRATQIQVRCVVLLEEGLVEGRSDWLALPDQLKSSH